MLCNAQYSPRSQNHKKAQDNWERKAKHLSSEVVKFSTYIDALTHGIELKQTQVDKCAYDSVLADADAVEDAEAGVDEFLGTAAIPGGYSLTPNEDSDEPEQEAVQTLDTRWRKRSTVHSTSTTEAEDYFDADLSSAGLTPSPPAARDSGH